MIARPWTADPDEPDPAGEGEQVLEVIVGPGPGERRTLVHAETVDGHRVEVGSDRVIVTPTGNRVVLLVVHVDAEYVAGGPFNRRDRFLRDVAPALADHGVAELLRFPNLLDPWT